MSRTLGVALAVGLLIRLLILFQTPDLDARIVDERQYIELGTSLLNGHGFAWATGEATSLRPPLYPAFLAAVWWLAGEGNLQAVRIVQCGIALVTAALVYLLGRRVFDPGVARMASAITWLYPSLIYLNVSILGETLFTCLLVAFVLFAVMLIQRPGPAIALACGVALGLGALTRSVLWPVPVLLCPLLVLLVAGTLRSRVTIAVLVLVGFAAVVGPWAVRNTRLQGVVTIVDTMGGMNLRMGNYEHTPEDRMWDAVSLTGEKNWAHALTLEPPEQVGPNGAFTEGMKDKWAQRKAIEYIAAHPVTTVRRSVIKFGDFWGLEREFVAAAQQGLYAPPTWFVVATTLLMLMSYVALVGFGGAGLWLAHPEWRAHVLLLLPIVVMTGVHALVFGHSRYHLPLIPLLALYAAAMAQRPRVSAWRSRHAAATGAAITLVFIAGLWVRQILIVDAARVRSFLDGLR